MVHLVPQGMDRAMYHRVRQPSTYSTWRHTGLFLLTAGIGISISSLVRDAGFSKIGCNIQARVRNVQHVVDHDVISIIEELAWLLGTLHLLQHPTFSCTFSRLPIPLRQ